MLKRLWYVSSFAFLGVNAYGLYVQHRMNKSRAALKASQAEMAARHKSFGTDYLENHHAMMTRHAEANEILDRAAAQFLPDK